MKKLLVILTIALSIVTLNVKAEEVELPPKADHKPVNVYLFYADWCGNCHKFIQYFADNYKDYTGKYNDYFKIVAFESGSNTANNALAIEVKNQLGIEDSQFGWPFIVVGDEHYIGYSSVVGQNVIEDALKAYQNDSYQDIVEAAIKKTNSEAKQESLEEAAATVGIEIKVEDEGGIPDSVIVAIIFVVVIGALGSLVFFSRK